MDYPCVICKRDVGDADKAFQCELCDNWEHVDCIRGCERPDGTLYEVLVRYRTKCVSFICTYCHKKGSLSKQFMKCEHEIAHAHDERLASERLLEQSEARVQASEQTIIDLKQECDALQAEVKKLTHELLKLKMDSPSGKTTALVVTKEEPEAPEHESLKSSSSESAEDTTSRRTSTSARSPILRDSKKCPVAWRSLQARKLRMARSRCGSRILRKLPQIAGGLIT